MLNKKFVVRNGNMGDLGATPFVRCVRVDLRQVGNFRTGQARKSVILDVE